MYNSSYLKMFENIGSFGAQGFQNQRKIVMGLCSLLSILCFILLVTAASANSNQEMNLTNAGWTHVEFTGISDYYYGFIGYYHLVQSGKSSFVSFNDCISYTNYCNSCESAGQSTLGLLIVSVILTIALISLSILRYTYDSVVIKLTSLLVAFFIFLFSTIAMGVYGNTCNDAIIKEFSHSTGFVSLYKGFYITFFAYFFIIIIFIFHLFTPVTIVETTKIFNLV